MEQAFRGNERFEVLGLLGSGGFGSVYRALDRRLGQTVALKVLHRLDPPTLYRFKKEFRLFADLRHPNLVALYELFSEGDEWFFTMELVAGIDWMSFVRRGQEADPVASTLEAGTPAGPAKAPSSASALASTLAAPVSPAGPDLARLRASLRQVVDGLVALHEAGVVHRDVKPSNLLVTRTPTPDGAPSDRVVILDLGIAQATQDGRPQLTDANLILGTPAYMAPEQAVSARVTPAADWYAFGVMLFEALTGRFPFDGSAIQVLTDKQQKDAPDPRSLWPEAPADLAQLCGRLLRRAPEERPTGTELLHSLGPASPRGPSPTTSAEIGGARFVGRGSLLDTLAEAFKETRNGKQAIALIQGASGMGKSSLAKAFTDRLDEGTVVLAGRCYQRESVPYKAFDGIVDELSRCLRSLPRDEAARVTPRDAAALARLFPVLERVPAIAEAPRKVTALADAQLLRQRAFAALRELLGRLADARPVAVFIDDVQWGDEDSARLLVELVMPPDPPPILLLLACRDSDKEASPLLEALRHMAGAQEVLAGMRTLDIGPLPQQDAEALVGGLLDTPRQGQAANILREAEGHPLLLRELAMHAASAGPEAAGGRLLTWLIEQRLASLPERARKLLEVLCVVGHPVDREVVARASGLESAAVNQAVGALRLAHLLRSVGPQGDRLEAYHDRIRETVAATLTPERLSAIHREVAHALIEAGQTAPDALFAHCREAGMNEQAAEFAQAAADHAAQALAFDHAAQFYREALALGGLSDERLRELRARLGESLANAGRGPAAAEAFLAALPGASTAEGLELQRRAAEQLLFAGKMTEGMEALRGLLAHANLALPATKARAVAMLLVLRLWLLLRGLRYTERDASTVPPSHLARLDVCWALAVGLSSVDNLRAQVLNSQHLLWAIGCGEPRRVCKSLALEAVFISTAGQRSYDKAHRLLAQAEALAQQLRVPELDLLIDGCKGTIDFCAGRWRAASLALDRTMTLQREHGGGSLWERDAVLMFSLLTRAYLGELRELCRIVPVEFENARERGDVFLAVNLRLAECNWVHLVADDSALAREQVEQAILEWRQISHQMQHYWAMQALIYADLYEGRYEAGLRRHEEGAAGVRASMVRLVRNVDITWVMLRARCVLGLAAAPAHQKELGSVIRAAKHIAKDGVPWGQTVSSLLLAGVAARRGNREQAVAELRRALLASEETEMALYSAVTRWKLGDLLGGDEGEVLAERGKGWLVEQGVKRPERFAAMFAPGLET